MQPSLTLGLWRLTSQILGVRRYNEDVLLLAIPTTTYSERVPVMVGSKIIDKTLSCMTAGELANATATWRQAHFGAVMSGSLPAIPQQLRETGKT